MYIQVNAAQFIAGFIVLWARQNLLRRWRCCCTCTYNQAKVMPALQRRKKAAGVWERAGDLPAAAPDQGSDAPEWRIALV